jgi:hypothetical protein
MHTATKNAKREISHFNLTDCRFNKVWKFSDQRKWSKRVLAVGALREFDTNRLQVPRTVSGRIPIIWHVIEKLVTPL